jgi:hypothetical protein
VIGKQFPADRFEHSNNPTILHVCKREEKLVSTVLAGDHQL